MISYSEIFNKNYNKKKLINLYIDLLYNNNNNITMELNNYKYINETYKLPFWFDFTDIDWLRYYAMKNNKEIKEPTEKTLKEGL